MKLRAIILGCGSSAGVPRLGGPEGKGDWGACDPDNPKNFRTRCSIIIQRADDKEGWEAAALTTLLVDTSPELRLQLLREGIARVDAVLYTHDHADQTHGIDDLRALAIRGRSRIPVFIDEGTAPNLVDRFSYCFRQPVGSPYPPILDLRPMPLPGDRFEVDGPTGPIAVRSLLLQHGSVPSLGYRFGDEHGIAYSPDVNAVPADAFDVLRGVDTWIVDALRYHQHPTHSHLSQSLEWLATAGVRRGVLTNLHIDMDYERVRSETPEHVTPAYDGMMIV